MNKKTNFEATILQKTCYSNLNVKICRYLHPKCSKKCNNCQKLHNKISDWYKEGNPRDKYKNIEFGGYIKGCYIVDNDEVINIWYQINKGSDIMTIDYKYDDDLTYNEKELMKLDLDIGRKCFVVRLSKNERKKDSIDKNTVFLKVEQILEIDENMNVVKKLEAKNIHPSAWALLRATKGQDIERLIELNKNYHDQEEKEEWLDQFN